MKQPRKTRKQPFYVSLGASLRQLRENKGWTQGRMASLVGVSFQMVQKYENGTCRIPVDRYIQWLAACGQMLTIEPIKTLPHHAEGDTIIHVQPKTPDNPS